MNKCKRHFLMLLLCIFYSPAFTDVVIKSDTTEWGVFSQEERYILDSDVTITSAIDVKGIVTLYLSKNCTLEASNGITVSAGNTLIIEGEGTVKATGGSGCAGIGGGNSGLNCTSGSIVINGGNIYATGGSRAAGIGGGGAGSNSNILTSLIVNDGYVEATGGSDAAGIGGGRLSSLGTFIINGGKVKAVSGSENAAGIGGGNGRSWAGAYGGCGEVYINGGEIEATATGTASAIGGGQGNAAGATCSKIEINGGRITASSKNGYALGSGIGGAAGSIIFNWTNPDSYINLQSSKMTFINEGVEVLKDFRTPETGEDGMTATKVTQDNICEMLKTSPIVPLCNYEVVFLNGNYYIGKSDYEKTFYGSKLQNPGNLVKENFTFKGWYKDRACTQAWNFNTDIVTGEMMLYAKFIANEIIITTPDLLEYTGSVISLTPQVTSKDGSLKLSDATDYTLSYKNSSGTTISTTAIKNPGLYSVIASGKNDYAGKSCTTSFRIYQNPAGEGTLESPYLISSVSDWKLVSDNLIYGISYYGKYFKLTSDLTGISSMGTAAYPFDGKFDGNNFAIIPVSDKPVFAYIRNAEIKDFYTTLSEEEAVKERYDQNEVSNIISANLSLEYGINKKIVSQGGKVLYISGMEESGLEGVYTLKDPGVEPVPVISFGGEVLSAGEDYEVYYEDLNGNSVTAPIAYAGIYKMVITGCGSYAGSFNHNFEVTGSLVGSAKVIKQTAEESIITMPVNGSVFNYDISDPDLYTKGYKIIIYDNGGEGGDFESGVSGNFTAGYGYVRIKAAQGFLLQVSGYVATKSNYEFLTVYDGDSETSETLYYKVHGENNPNEYFVNLSVQNTRSNSVLIYFHGTERTCQGIELNISLVETKKVKMHEDIFTPGSFYTTYYTDKENLLADDGTSVYYLVENNGKLMLKENLDRIIRKGQGVILRSSKEEILLYSTSLDTSDTSLLTGTEDGIVNVSQEVDGSVYVISVSNKGGVGLYKWTESIPANKAYLRRDE